MDFNIKKPLHILALLLLIASFIILIVFPILTFVGMFPSTQSAEYQEISESIKLMSEVFLLLLQIILVVFFMVIVPILWYILVNNCKLKETFSRLKLKLEDIDIAFLWGVLAAISIFIIFFVLEIILIKLGANPEELGNVQDLEQLFSPAALFLLVATQPIAEEIFFRGFLMEKISLFAGNNVAILSTSVLFGLAHMSYGKIYPVILPMVMGLILGYIVVRTKNLFSSIIAHITFNVVVLILSFFAKSLLSQSLIL